VVLRC